MEKRAIFHIKYKKGGEWILDNSWYFLKPANAKALELFETSPPDVTQIDVFRCEAGMDTECKCALLTGCKKM